MAEKSWLQRCGLTPVKGGLIVVLSIALVAVAWGQFSGTEPQVNPPTSKTASSKTTSGKTTSRPRPSVARSTAKPKQVTVVAQGPTSPVQLRPWPRVSVEQVVQFNPLRLPANLAVVHQESSQAEREDLHEELQEQMILVQRRRDKRQLLQEQGIRMIVVGPHGKSAYLGSQLIHEGDVVEGFVVKEIGPDGVELVELPAP